MQQLSKRLTAVAALVSSGSRLADIGTDHAYVPIRLVQEGRIPGALAMDVKDGPLARAREHIREQGLEQYIQTRKSDGLAALQPGEADTVLMAGMGGLLMIRILEAGRCHWQQVPEWILQPQSKVGEVRRFVREAGFIIADEDFVEEDGKYYPMMRLIGPGAEQKRVPVMRGVLEMPGSMSERQSPGVRWNTRLENFFCSAMIRYCGSSF